VNSNRLAGPYRGDIETMAGMSVLNGIPVDITPVFSPACRQPGSRMTPKRRRCNRLICDETRKVRERQYFGRGLPVELQTEVGSTSLGA
jgi:hypothetical protein